MKGLEESVEDMYQSPSFIVSELKLSFIKVLEINHKQMLRVRKLLYLLLQLKPSKMPRLIPKPLLRQQCLRRGKGIITLYFF